MVVPESPPPVEQKPFSPDAGMIIHAHNELGASPTIAVHGSRLSE